MSDGMEYSIVENFINCKVWTLIPLVVNHNGNIIIHVAIPVPITLLLLISSNGRTFCNEFSPDGERRFQWVPKEIPIGSEWLPNGIPRRSQGDPIACNEPIRMLLTALMNLSVLCPRTRGLMGGNVLLWSSSFDFQPEGM